MGKIYKDKKGSSCKLCKPHKNGWAKKKTAKQSNLEKVAEKEMKQHA